MREHHERSLFYDNPHDYLQDVQECYGLISGPLNVMWDVTYTCNLKCQHCYNLSGPDAPLKDLPAETLLGIADQIIEMSPPVVCLCGGEPFAKGDLLFQIAKKLTDARLTVNTVSNGSLINAETVDKIKQAGFSSVQISIDGATPETHDEFRGVKGSWEKAIRALEHLKQGRVQSAVTLIPNQLNYHEISDAIDLVADMGVNLFRMMPLLPIGRGADNLERLAINPYQHWQLQWLVQRKEQQYPRMLIEWGDPLEHLYLFPNNPKANNVSVEIRSDGTVPLSPYIPVIIADLKKRTLKEYWEMGLRDVWKQPSIKRMANKYKCLDDFYDQEIAPWTGADIEIPEDQIYRGADH